MVKKKLAIYLMYDVAHCDQAEWNSPSLAGRRGAAGQSGAA